MRHIKEPDMEVKTFIKQSFTITRYGKKIVLAVKHIILVTEP